MAVNVPGEVKETFERAYYDVSNPVGYTGKRLLKQIYHKKNLNAHINDWFKAQDAYTLHRPIRRKFQRLHYNVTNIDDVWEADLIDLRSLATYNDGFCYILVIIDVLSKYVWVEPLRDKSGNEVKGALRRIFARNGGRVPVCMQSDCGKEFVAESVRSFLAKHNIHFRVVRNPDVKAAVVERFNRTLKERMWRYFTHRNTKRYVDVLQQIVAAYNHTRHTSIKMTPASVTLQNAAVARANLESRSKRRRPRLPKYKVGEYVRISRTKGTFEKGYEANWSEEIFEIISANSMRQGIPVYELRDLAGEDIEGFFYEEELGPVLKDFANEEFEIERVIREKGRGKNRQLLVHWRGYPDKFNSWIPADSLKKK